ncbi:DUF6088 family protein [Pseudomonas tohonis]|uniref:DUF6088 family protein n=1 Tax=Pseudomonas tohonis TaxID=2725477 RepID=UPI001F330A7D|nr:DUF6088 family protein [Pseudomonas tohonis]
MASLSAMILSITQQLPEGEVVAPGRFLHLGSRSAVQRGLSGLVVDEKLVRVARGFYAATVESRFGRRAPAPDRVVRSLANALGEVIVENGARSANKLGLTTQVPVRYCFLSTGRSRELQIGRIVVSIQHAPSWMMTLGATGAGDAVRALAWLGPLWAAGALSKLHAQLPEHEWLMMVSALDTFPAWIGNAIRVYIGSQ